MRLTPEQSYELLKKHCCYASEACDKCGQLLGPVRYTRKNDGGVWCSQKCRGDEAQRTVRRGGRPRKHLSNSEKQRAYRGRILGVTKPSRSLTETKGLQAQKSPLSHYPFASAVPTQKSALGEFGGASV